MSCEIPSGDVFQSDTSVNLVLTGGQGATPRPEFDGLKWLPVVDEDLCTGCAACVEACGPKSLEIVDRVAALVRSDTCGSEEHCIAPCPTDAIQMRWVTASGDQAHGKWRAEACETRMS